MAIDQFAPASKRELGDMRGTARFEPTCDRLIGSGSSSQGVYDLIRRVSNLDAFILITGESGTGKELVARAIHKHQPSICGSFCCSVLWRYPRDFSGSRAVRK